MVDFEDVWLGSKLLHNIIESSDSGAASGEEIRQVDGEAILALPEDYSSKLNDVMRDIMVKQNNVVWSRDYCDLPCHKIMPFSRDIFAAATGPEGGIKSFNLGSVSPSSKTSKRSKKGKNGQVFSGWTKRHYRAYGISTSLYDCDPVTNQTSGDPVADVYAVIARENSCILALADGVNWGEKSRLAARCAVAGCIQYLNNNMLSAINTHDIMSLLLEAFKCSQELIIEKDATMTTLCVAVVCQLERNGKWGLCVVNVGDSLAFTYKKHEGVQEVTIGSHFDIEDRDMRCPGGSLGPVDGYNPDLRNLTFSFTVLEAGDLVFLTSDGVSDNFDPIVAQCKHCDVPPIKRSKSLDSMLDIIPRGKSTWETLVENNAHPHSSRTDDYLTDHDLSYRDVSTLRQKKMLDDMTKVIQAEGLEDHVSAMEVCAKLLSHVCRCTAKKRSFLEQVDRDGHQLNLKNMKFKRLQDKEIGRLMRELPGKLDHAAVVAFEVGHFSVEPLKVVSPGQLSPKRKKSIFDGVLFPGRKANTPESSQDDFESDGPSYTELYSLLGV